MQAGEELEKGEKKGVKIRLTVTEKGCSKKEKKSFRCKRSERKRLSGGNRYGRNVNFPFQGIAKERGNSSGVKKGVDPGRGF